MKLHSATPAGQNLITAYDAHRVAVGSRVLSRSGVVAPDRLIEDWGPAPGEALSEAHIAALAELGYPVLLLGTGVCQRFPAPALLRPLIARQIGLEVMDTGAACRTYNILVAEGRAVAAALIIDADAA